MPQLSPSSVLSFLLTITMVISLMTVFSTRTKKVHTIFNGKKTRKMLFYCFGVSHQSIWVSKNY